jgi:rhodanese-related sulfurtransferase
MPKLMRSTSVFIVALFVAVLFAGSFAFAAEEAKSQSAGPASAGPASVGPSKDWTDKEVQEFSKKPWTEEELKAMGRDKRYIINKTLVPRNTGKDLTAKQMFENAQNSFRAIMWQYGIGISTKDFYKIWIEQEGWKNPKIKLLDVRQESEFQEGHVPGAIRVDTGLSYWQLQGKAPDATADYYLMCKAGTPDNGGNRGAAVKKAMIDMGYTGKILNVTDGFRGWIESGYPVINQHGLWVLVPGTFQLPEKDAMEREKVVAPVVAPAIVGMEEKLVPKK